MPVVLISETERFKWIDEETASYMIYRRPTSAKQREVQAANTENGLINQNEYLEDLIEWSVLDWGCTNDDTEAPDRGGFVNDLGAPLAFAHGLTRDLPDSYKARFILNLYLIDPIKDQMGN